MEKDIESNQINFWTQYNLNSSFGQCQHQKKIRRNIFSVKKRKIEILESIL